jgi:hypothetical protein
MAVRTCAGSGRAGAAFSLARRSRSFSRLTRRTEIAERCLPMGAYDGDAVGLLMDGTTSGAARWDVDGEVYSRWADPCSLESGRIESAVPSVHKEQ